MSKRKPRPKPIPTGKRVKRSYPRCTVEEALKIALALKEKNGGNPWSPEEVADAIGMSPKTNDFFYLAAASREYGLTVGSRDSKVIDLTPFGRDLVYAPNAETEMGLKRDAFLNVEKFKQVLG